MGFDLSVNMLWVCDCGVCLANKDTSMTMVVSYYPYIYIFDNLKCPDQRFEDTHTSTNPRETRNTLLARVPQ